MFKATHAQMENLKDVLFSEEEMMLGLQCSAWSPYVSASCSWTQCGKRSSGAARKGTEPALSFGLQIFLTQQHQGDTADRTSAQY